MPLMNVFEPLFLLLVVTTIATLVTALTWALRGQFARAGRILRRLALGGAAYFAVVIVVSIAQPRREHRIGDPHFFDDWCVAVIEAHRADLPDDTAFDVSLRLSNRARRV